MSNMNSKTIEITVNPTGDTTVETKGFAGPACRDATKFIERALGERTGEKLTGEFYNEEQGRQRVSEE